MSDNVLSFAKQVGEDIADIFKRFRPSKERTLDADEDLNTLLDRGVYNATLNMADWQAQNYPGNLRGYVVVEKMESVNLITQYFYSRSNLDVPYIAYRFMTSAEWSPWVQIQPDPPAYVPQDTGMRDITASIPADAGWEVPSSAGSGVYAQRIGDIVFLSVSSVANSSGSTEYVTLVNLPAGFRPNRSQYGNTWRGVRTYLRTSGRLDFQSPSDPVDYWSFSYVTNDAWPTSLPGTPA